MKIDYRPTNDEVSNARKESYLSEYPIEKQLEALTEAAMGNDSKLKSLISGLNKIRQNNPYCGE